MCIRDREFLRSTETDNPGIEHGPGFVTLLARDYGWRTTADVLNRGYSGMSSAMLRADLPMILGPLRRQDVRAVTLFIGANDCVAAGEPTHVPLEQYRENVRYAVPENGPCVTYSSRGLEPRSFDISSSPLPSFLPLGLLCGCLLYTSPSPRDATLSRMPSSA